MPSLFLMAGMALVSAAPSFAMNMEKEKSQLHVAQAPSTSMDLEAEGKIAFASGVNVPENIELSKRVLAKMKSTDPHYRGLAKQVFPYLSSENQYKSWLSTRNYLLRVMSPEKDPDYFTFVPKQLLSKRVMIIYPECFEAEKTIAFQPGFNVAENLEIAKSVVLNVDPNSPDSRYPILAKQVLPLLDSTERELFKVNTRFRFSQRKN